MMRKKTILWLCAGAALVLLGCMIFFGALVAVKFDFSRSSTAKYEKITHEITESYTNISIISDTADILLVQTEDEAGRVECYEQENLKHSVSVKDGTLVIEVSDTRAWYEYIGINFDSSKVIVYVPKGTYGSLTVKADTSDVEIAKKLVFESVDITLSTGDVTCGACATSIKIQTTTGDVSLIDVIVSDKLFIQCSTGDVEFDACDAAEIIIETSTGDVEGSLLSGKTFAVHTDTGEVRIPQNSAGGRCEIITDTGDVEITVGSVKD